MSANTLNEIEQNERSAFNGWPMIGEDREIREDSTRGDAMRKREAKPGMNTFKNVIATVLYRHRGKFLELGKKRQTPDIPV